MANKQSQKCNECGGRLIQEFEGTELVIDPDFVETNYYCENCGIQVQIEETVNELRIIRDDISGISSRSASVNNPDRAQRDFLGQRTTPLTVTKIRGLEAGTGEQRRIAQQHEKINVLLQQEFLYHGLPKITDFIKEEILHLSLVAIKNRKHLRPKILLGACLYEVLKIHRKPTSLKQISESLGNTENSTNSKELEKSIFQLYSKLRNEPEFGKAIIDKSMPINPIECVTGSILKECKVSDFSMRQVHSKSVELYEKIEETSIFEGKSPLGIAAALVLKSMEVWKLKPVQAKIARAFGVSDLTVRTNSAMIDTILERNSA